MERKLQVFISSTYIDLIEDRQAAVEAVLEAGHIPAGMELFKSGKSQMETIKNWIDESDIYMLILGGRYGSIEEKSKKSYTQLEYEYALSKGMPIFSIIIEKDELDNRLKNGSLPPEKIIELYEKPKYDSFKQLVSSKICSFFTDTKDIKISVHKHINEFEKKYELSGWIKGNEKNELESLIQENTKLKEKIAQLENRLHFQYDELDKNTYMKIKETLPDSLIDFLENNNFAGFSFDSERLSPLYNFEYISIKPDFEFLDAEMEKLKQNMYKISDELTNLIASQTFPTENGRNTVPPEWEYEQPDRFKKVVNDIHTLKHSFVKTYTEFVKLGRRKYKI